MRGALQGWGGHAPGAPVFHRVVGWGLHGSPGALRVGGKVSLFLTHSRGSRSSRSKFWLGFYRSSVL